MSRLAVPQLAIDEPSGSTPAAFLDGMRPVTVFVAPEESESREESEEGEASEEGEEAPDDAPDAPVHSPVLSESEYGGECEQCGGAVFYCRHCDRAYCSACEDPACPGAAYPAGDF